MHSDDVVAANGDFKSAVSGNFDADGKIKSDSSLAKYITYCGQRTSGYGLKDAAIY